MPADPPPRDASREPEDLPGLTACALCAGETLGDGDPLAGGQAERLRRLAGAGAARLTFVECLDECERGDVVVARPAGRCRRTGAAPVWFERLAGDGPTARLADWLRAGGPGAVLLPAELAHLVVARTGPRPERTQPDPS